jgi:hypothetical protein
MAEAREVMDRLTDAVMAGNLNELRPATPMTRR